MLSRGVVLIVFAACSHGESSQPSSELDRLRASCESGTFESCSKLGEMHARGKDAPHDLAKAATLFQQACDCGYLAGCANLGLSYGHGYGVARDAKKALALDLRACDGGALDGCTQAGTLYCSSTNILDTSAHGHP